MRVLRRSRLYYYLTLSLLLFQKTTVGEQEVIETTETEETDDKFSRIRCPLCNWQPGSWATWCCGDCLEPENFTGGCGTCWNTFETHGLCPGCHHQWTWTICLYCGQWSLHEDWYTEADQDN